MARDVSYGIDDDDARTSTRANQSLDPTTPPAVSKLYARCRERGLTGFGVGIDGQGERNLRKAFPDLRSSRGFSAQKPAEAEERPRLLRSIRDGRIDNALIDRIELALELRVRLAVGERISFRIAAQANSIVTVG